EGVRGAVQEGVAGRGEEGRGGGGGDGTEDSPRRGGEGEAAGRRDVGGLQRLPDGRGHEGTARGLRGEGVAGDPGALQARGEHVAGRDAADGRVRRESEEARRAQAPAAARVGGSS